jgi:hypothetical protein
MIYYGTSVEVRRVSLSDNRIRALEAKMRCALAVLLFVVLSFPLTANAVDVWGDQWGTWTRDNSPYNVIGEIRVPPESTLVIEPGVIVDFQGYYALLVDSSATLLAVGNETDSVVFTCDTLVNPDRWHGIRFFHSSCRSQLSYCIVEYGKALGIGEDQKGGGIYCEQSEPTITSNTIRHNSAEGPGGGLYLNWSGPPITGNVISGNSAGSEGGGIYLHECYNVYVTDNTIAGNSALKGGGIYCEEVSMHVTGNTIMGNSALQGGLESDGGGICAIDSMYVDVSIAGNAICGNSASDEGGGVYLQCYDYWGSTGDPAPFSKCPSTHGKNTISGNSAGRWGAGVCLAGNGVLVSFTSSIFWGDTAPGTPEIKWRDDARVFVTYSDVQGGYTGEGNINADPLFVNPEAGDFHLEWGSPCIDAGNPNSPPDPDGSRADMGAFPFLYHFAEVAVTPKNPPIRIPPQGGTFRFEATVTNTTDSTQHGNVWTAAIAPDGSHWGPLFKLRVHLVAYDTVYHPNVTQKVPGQAPLGLYHYVAYVGRYPSIKADSSYFTFIKTGKSTGGDWSVRSWFEETPEPSLPVATSLLGNHPNPFNSSTTIEYRLSGSALVRLEILNVRGEKVATLMDGKQQAGYRSAMWDASEASSGVYFYRLTAGDYAETKSMLLVK